MNKNLANAGGIRSNAARVRKPVPRSPLTQLNHDKFSEPPAMDDLTNALKSAGFPFKDQGCRSCIESARPCDVSVLPPLSALIEACGDRFYDLRHSGKWWAAGFFEQGIEDLHEVCGETAEEAVAKLWIVLHRR